MLGSNPIAARRLYEWGGHCRVLSFFYPHSEDHKRKIPGVWGQSPHSVNKTKTDRIRYDLYMITTS
jgi:hypothetical protein